MKIQFVEIRNFRKLASVRIDFDKQTTLCVGANNSGKTSAMIALSHFLVHPSRFTTNDFTVSNWTEINKLAIKWDTAPPAQEQIVAPAEWDACLPSLDLWLSPEDSELHRVRDLLPVLDWAGGDLGVRIRYEPKHLYQLSKEYIEAFKTASETRTRAKDESGTTPNVTLWPTNLRMYLDRKLRNAFELRYYLLDPEKRVKPVHGIAQPQALPAGSDPLEHNPLTGLIRIDEIPAQRGFGESSDRALDDESGATRSLADRRKLSEQLRGYYTRHLDPSDYPEPADVKALEAIETAQSTYNDRLTVGFKDALKELEQLNYPGVTDPKLTIATRLRPSDGLNHSAAVQYDVIPADPTSGKCEHRLPEEYNGLGYQNLISMVFKLMSFRDAWMRVGKASKAPTTETPDVFQPPLHLVLIEEPEAYLHAQVQQVFVKKAYEFLRNHKDLKENPTLSTQLIVSTHSSHIAHECEFECLRYFRRQPPKTKGQAPITAVINLSEVFGTVDDTARFATRYLKATHCDLFFADAAILVEGAAERMLLPQFIRQHFKKLHTSYLTVLELGSSHAHRLQKLIEKLGLITLIITDLDSVEAAGRHPATAPARGKGQLTANATLKSWHPMKSTVDDLLGVDAEVKAKVYSDMPQFAIRVAYQLPVQLSLPKLKTPEEALARSFEDSLIMANLKFFQDLGKAIVDGQIGAAIAESATAAEFTVKMLTLLNGLDKAAFALELLWLKNSDQLKPPEYITEGLSWLTRQLVLEEASVKPAATAAPSKASVPSTKARAKP